MSSEAQASSSQPSADQDEVFDMNNNDPNNNTEFNDHSDAKDESDTEEPPEDPPDMDEIQVQLLKEARQICTILDNKFTVSEIYSYLEASIDNPDRVQVVLNSFLLRGPTEPAKNHKRPNSRSANHPPVKKDRLDETVMIESDPEDTLPDDVYCVSSGDEEEVVVVKKKPTKRGAAKQVVQETGDQHQNGQNGNEQVDQQNGNEQVDQQDGDGMEVGVQNGNEPVAEAPGNNQEVDLIHFDDEDQLGAAMVNEPVIPRNAVVLQNGPDAARCEEDVNSLREMFPHIRIEVLRARYMQILPIEGPNTLGILVTQMLDAPDLDANIMDLSIVADPVNNPAEVAGPSNNPQPGPSKPKAGPSKPTAGTSKEPRPGPSKEDDDVKDEVDVPDEQNNITPELREQHSYLMGVLPNADPDFLLQKVIQFKDDKAGMAAFTADALENPTYPTLEEYNKRTEAEQRLKKFTGRLTVPEFLDSFPNPETFFSEKDHAEDPVYINCALSYLMERFCLVPMTAIRIALRDCKNLVKAVDQLNTGKGFTQLKNRRSKWDNTAVEANKHLSFLQEVTYLKLKPDIEQYLKDKEEAQKAQFEEAKRRGELLECGCCFDSECLITSMSSCPDGHLFCKTCIRRYAENEIGDGKTKFKCLEGECPEEFTLTVLQEVLSAKVISRLVQKKQLEEVAAANIEGLETCPFCEFATIPAPGDRLFRCLNPDCMKDSCRECREPSHIPLRCDEVEKDEELQARKLIEDRMTEALVRECYKCHKKFVKQDGCNKMRCACGAIMCYICRQPITGYDHFSDNRASTKPINGKCPLWVNNDELHVQEVTEVANKAKEELKAKDPNLTLKHDPTKVLPKAQAPQVESDVARVRQLINALRQAVREYREQARPDVPERALENRHLNNAVRAFIHLYPLRFTNLRIRANMPAPGGEGRVVRIVDLPEYIGHMRLELRNLLREQLLPPGLNRQELEDRQREVTEQIRRLHDVRDDPYFLELERRFYGLPPLVHQRPPPVDPVPPPPVHPEPPLAIQQEPPPIIGLGLPVIQGPPPVHPGPPLAIQQEPPHIPQEPIIGLGHPVIQGPPRVHPEPPRIFQQQQYLLEQLNHHVRQEIAARQGAARQELARRVRQELVRREARNAAPPAVAAPAPERGQEIEPPPSVEPNDVAAALVIPRRDAAGAPYMECPPPVLEQPLPGPRGPPQPQQPERPGPPAVPRPRAWFLGPPPPRVAWAIDINRQNPREGAPIPGNRGGVRPFQNPRYPEFMLLEPPIVPRAPPDPDLGPRVRPLPPNPRPRNQDADERGQDWDVL